MAHKLKRIDDANREDPLLFESIEIPKLSSLDEYERLIIEALKTPKRDEIFKVLQCVSRRP